MPQRIEKDFIGEVEVPKITYFGMQTMRAADAFRISDLQWPVEFITALALVKKACAMANIDKGALQESKGLAIARACDEIYAGAHMAQFVVDVFQAGGGASLNMNMNEVLANRALEIMGLPKGSYDILSPCDHVNRSHADADAFSTALRVALLGNAAKLAAAVSELKNAFLKKSIEFDFILKSSRTGCQDSVPITLGQEFISYAEIMKKCGEDLEHSKARLRYVSLGGTEVGTGLGAPEGFSEAAIAKLAELSKLELEKSENMVELTAFSYDLMDFSSRLRGLASSLIKISSDISLSASGPATGFNEITLPPVHPASSMVPGKVGPAMLEMLAMAAMRAAGSDQVVLTASTVATGNMNVFLPVMAYELLSSSKTLANAINAVALRCVPNITANEASMREDFESSLGLAALLVSKTGYAEAAEIACEARNSKKTVLEIAIARKLLDEGDLEAIRTPRRVTEPGGLDRR